MNRHYMLTYYALYNKKKLNNTFSNCGEEAPKSACIAPFTIKTRLEVTVYRQDIQFCNKTTLPFIPSN